MVEHLDRKAQLVAEICSISQAFLSCTHRSTTTTNATFVDWYMILRVEEDAGQDLIRRRYRQLALQLHPDKNSHPKAEVAFKLVSEAYACLSDAERRKAFDSERRKSCRECHENQFGLQKNYTHRQRIKEFQRRIREENRVIEDYLGAYRAWREEDSPLFDPSDRRLFPDYPHSRAYLVSRKQQQKMHCWHKCESPLYQIRTENPSSGKC